MANIVSPDLQAYIQVSNWRDEFENDLTGPEVGLLVQIISRVFAAQDAAHYTSPAQSKPRPAEILRAGERQKLTAMLQAYPDFSAAVFGFLADNGEQ